MKQEHMATQKCHLEWCRMCVRACGKQRCSSGECDTKEYSPIQGQAQRQSALFGFHAHIRCGCTSGKCRWRHNGRQGVCVRTCRILQSGFSSSGVKITSSLSKPYSPSWPENTRFGSERLHQTTHYPRIHWSRCCRADCNAIIKVQPLSHKHTGTNRSCLHLCAQASLYFQLFCVIPVTHQRFFFFFLGTLFSIYKHPHFVASQDCPNWSSVNLSFCQTI